jgi:hypothetical protein
MLNAMASSCDTLSISPDGLTLAMCQLGNMVRVISIVDLKTQQAVTGLRCADIRHDLYPLSTGLIVEPRHGMVVLNGLPGDLQFLDSEKFQHVMEVCFRD